MMALLLALLTAAPAAAGQPGISAAPDTMSKLVTVPPRPGSWQTVSGPFLRVHGDPSEMPAMVRLANHAADSLPRLAKELQVPIGDTIHVYLTSTDTEFRELQPGRTPTWADGTAWPGLGIIYLRAPHLRAGTATPLEKVLDHELVHILLGRAFAPAHPPTWLQEGLAQTMAGEYSPETTRRLARGMLGGLLSLERISNGFPSDPVQADLAYAQSADFFAWLRVEYGPDAQRIIVRELSRGEDVRAAVRRATGKSLDAVDKEWRGRLTEATPLSISAIATENTFWMAGALLLAVGGVMRRRRFHERLAEMEAEEAALDALLADVVSTLPRSDQPPHH